MPVDIECLSESQLIALKNKIDSKLTQKSNSRISDGSYKAHKILSVKSNNNKDLELGEKNNFKNSKVPKNTKSEHNTVSSPKNN